MKLLGAMVAILALSATGSIWEPVFEAPQSTRLQMVGVSEVLPEDFSVIDAVLARRAPGMGMLLRKQVAVAISEEAHRARFDPLLILGLIDVESDFQEEAVSPMGAKGLMQIQPTTLYFLAQREGLKLSREEVSKDPSLCVRLGIRYLRQLYNQFGNLDLALMAYNMGPNKLLNQIKLHELEQYRGYPRAVRREYLTLRHGLSLGGDWAVATRTSPQK